LRDFLRLAKGVSMAAREAGKRRQNWCRQQQVVRAESLCISLILLSMSRLEKLFPVTLNRFA